MVVDLMEREIFHSTLDWVSDAQFRRGAREAWELLESDRELFEDYYRKARQAFQEMRAASDRLASQTDEAGHA